MLLALIAALSVIVGAAIAGIYNLRAKQNEYVNDYYGTVVARRIAAYEQLESLVLGLKTCVVAEDDNRPYHLLFSSEKDEDWDRAFTLLGSAMSHTLWLSEEVAARLRDLNYLLFHMNKPTSVVEFGRTNYDKIATLRADLERLLAKDMLNLHKVKRFLSSKARQDEGFHLVHLKK